MLSNIITATIGAAKVWILYYFIHYTLAHTAPHFSCRHTKITLTYPTQMTTVVKKSPTCDSIADADEAM